MSWQRWRAARGIGLVGLAMTVLFAGAPRAMAEPGAEAGMCALHQIMPIERQLRRLSLALRGHAPPVEEYALVEGESVMPEAIIDAYLDADSFRYQMRRYHLQQLWPSPVGAQLFDVTINIRLIAGDIYDTAFSVGRRRYRGGNGSHFCQNVPQTDLQPSYQLGDRPLCEVKGYDTIVQGTQTVQAQWCQEGYVELNPYWLPVGQTVKVCAFVAQTIEDWPTVNELADPNNANTVDLLGEDLDGDAILDSGEDVNANGFLDASGDYDHDFFLDTAGETARCSYGQAAVSSRAGCGCGPRLNFCARFGDDLPVWEAMTEQFLRLTDQHTFGVGGEPAKPYSGILTNRSVSMNGPLLHLYRYWANSPGLVGTTYNAQHSGDALLPPDSEISFLDESNWREFERQAPHAGVLTLPAYTLRFQTNRGRANRFRIAFMDQYFDPPSVYEQSNCDPASADLTQKCVCKGCHGTLEPLAAYFGTVAERGSALLTDFVKDFEGTVDGVTAFQQCVQQWTNNTQVPAVHKDVQSNQLCQVLYSADYDYPPPIAHRLNPLYYKDDHPEYETHFDAGPTGIAKLATDNISEKNYSLLARATVKHLFTFLFKRDMVLDATAADSEFALYEQLATEFTEQDDLKALVKRLVMLDTFGRWP